MFASGNYDDVNTGQDLEGLYSISTADRPEMEPVTVTTGVDVGYRPVPARGGRTGYRDEVRSSGWVNGRPREAGNGMSSESDVTQQSTKADNTGM